MEVLHFNSLYPIVFKHQSSLLHLHGTFCNTLNLSTTFKNPFESKWKADAVLPYITAVQLHRNSEYSDAKAQSNFMQNP